MTAQSLIADSIPHRGLDPSSRTWSAICCKYKHRVTETQRL